jgi:hypothetical protein
MTNVSFRFIFRIPLILLSLVFLRRLFNDALSVEIILHPTVRWLYSDQLEGSARGLIQIQSRNLPGGTEDTHNDSRYPEQSSSQIRVSERYLRTNRSLSVIRRKRTSVKSSIRKHRVQISVQRSATRNEDSLWFPENLYENHGAIMTLWRIKNKLELRLVKWQQTYHCYYQTLNLLLDNTSLN